MMSRIKTLSTCAKAVLITRASRFNDPLMNERGVAALEFALILPLMIGLYLGTVEISSSYMASRKVGLLTRTLSDLAAQQLTCDANPAKAPCMGSTELTRIFSAAKLVLAPLPSGVDDVKMAITQVNIRTNAASGEDQKNYAYVRWSASPSASMLRPCSGDGQRKNKLSKDNNPLAAANIPSGRAGYKGAFPVNYTVAGSLPGSVIVADVVYNYKPTFALSYISTNADGARVLNESQYFRTRSGNTIAMLASSSGAVQVTDCPTNPD